MRRLANPGKWQGTPPDQIKQGSNGGNPFQAFIAFAFFLRLEEGGIDAQGRKQGQRGGGNRLLGKWFHRRNEPIQIATGIGTKSENEYGMSFLDLDPQNAGEFPAHAGKADPPPRLLAFRQCRVPSGNAQQRAEPIVEPMGRKHTVGVETDDETGIRDRSARWVGIRAEKPVDPPDAIAQRTKQGDEQKNSRKEESLRRAAREAGRQAGRFSNRPGRFVIFTFFVWASGVKRIEEIVEKRESCLTRRAVKRSKS